MTEIPDDPSDSAESKKSRNRVPTSCSVCRRRKMKCDKQRPHCGACIETGYAELCIYESQPWEKSLAQENRRLRVQVSEMEDRIKQLEERLRAYGPGADKGSNAGGTPDRTPKPSKKPAADPSDPVFDLTEKFDVMIANEEKLMHYGTTSFVSLMNEEYIVGDHYRKIILRLDVENNIWGVSHPPISTHSPLVEGGEDKRTMLNAYAKILGIQGDSFRTSNFLPDLSRQFQEIIPPINAALPPRRIFDLLLERFFRYVYSVTPYVDEITFKKELDVILFTNANDGRVFFSISRYSQLSTVCTCLVLLRFAYITITPKELLTPTINPFDKQQDLLVAEIALSGVVVGSNFIEFAKQCLSYGAVFRNTDMRNVQALLLFKMYRFYSPESGKEGFECVLAILVHMARVHGLHRDPGKFGKAIPDERTKHLWRKIWAQLIFLDSAQAIFYGCPLLIYDDQYDTKAPFLSDGLLAKGGLFEHEEQVVENIALQLEVSTLVRSIVKLCSNISLPPKRSELVLKLLEVDYVLNFRLQSFEDFFKLNDAPVPDWAFLLRGVQCGLRVCLTSAYYTVNCILYLTCLPEETELRKKFSDTSIERAMILVKLCYNFFGNQSSRVYNHGLETLLAPLILDGALPALHMFCTTSIRNSFDLTKFSDAIESFKSVDAVGVLRWFVLYSSAKQTTPAGCILLLVEELFYKSKALSTNYYRCYQICMILRMFIIIYKDFHQQSQNHQERMSQRQAELPRVEKKQKLEVPRDEFLTPSSVTSDTGSTSGAAVATPMSISSTGPIPGSIINSHHSINQEIINLSTHEQDDFWKQFFDDGNKTGFESVPNFSETMPNGSDFSTHFLDHMNNAIISLLPNRAMSSVPSHNFVGDPRMAPDSGGLVDEFGRRF
ncbi:hypothetical protein BABINDRAFT_161891 [Babjeviella inositovora NRRL Y-12698]|uniref:Zn(2)-C6 fungal-type domain-containing protein n=1 Tax=Babjeviella inositovora NRRL Y-12698 TaxID=984486 RepID=A0A1E3QP72_9ASCO|nr:uncharacterized protein BABINDRAFT_161891 [Babjeviella inositovora NRRL Y-12698]ODQ79493.1 hypothetical protein BABINDRAFT_161891 [Babjeviella inositovora NRRL Y-12698]